MVPRSVSTTCPVQPERRKEAWAHVPCSTEREFFSDCLVIPRRRRVGALPGVTIERTLRSRERRFHLTRIERLASALHRGHCAWTASFRRSAPSDITQVSFLPSVRRSGRIRARDALDDLARRPLVVACDVHNHTRARCRSNPDPSAPIRPSDARGTKAMHVFVNEKSHAHEEARC